MLTRNKVIESGRYYDEEMLKKDRTINHGPYRQCSVSVMVPLLILIFALMKKESAITIMNTLTRLRLFLIPAKERKRWKLLSIGSKTKARTGNMTA